MSTPLAHIDNKNKPLRISRFFPFIDWLFHYKREDLSGDIIAGIIVTVMLVPQSMAYALLAGLPPQVGLYASIAPIMVYGLLGTSRFLSVGPVAIDSLLVAAGISALQPESTEAYIGMAVILAFQIGIIQILMGLLRVGFVVNFLSHPVLSGFISAAAIVIAFSQLKHLLGIEMPRFDYFYEQLFYVAQHVSEINPIAVTIALTSILILLFFKKQVGTILRQSNVPESYIIPLTKIGPLVVVVLGTIIVGLFGLQEQANISVVGEVPAGLPSLVIPIFDLKLWQNLLPTALTISLVGFTESISLAKSLASKKRIKVDANQELVAIGASNLSAAFTGGYPVAGGLGRSVVNFNAGANTGLASMITAILMALTVLFLTPLFYYLPRAVLAGIIVVAVIGLIDFKTLTHTWSYNRTDALSLIVTFLAVLFMGIQNGILLGAVVAIALYLWRTSRPHIAVIGRIGDTEHYRNILRHDVHTEDHILAVRVDESLYFPNAQYLENTILGFIADYHDVEHVVLVCSAVNYIDSSALQVLGNLKRALNDSDVAFCLAEVKGPVMDRLQKIGFVDAIGKDNIYLSTHQAMQALTKSPA